MELAPSGPSANPNNAASLFDDDEMRGGDTDGSDQDTGSDDPFHFSVASLPEISFARGSTFPGLQADSRSKSQEFEESDSDSTSSDTERSSVATRHAVSKPPPVEEILYIQMASCSSEPPIPC